MSERNEAENMKEFMTLLMDVKVTLAEQSGKINNILDTVVDTKDKVGKAYDIALEANNRSKENEKDIAKIEEESRKNFKSLSDEIEKRANKQDVNKQNNVKNAIAITAIIASPFLSALVAFFMTK